MSEQVLLIAGTALILAVLALVGLVRKGQRWGSTAQERALELPGDEWFPPAPKTFVAMTRAVSIDASPEVVWPWLAQFGRGAGWYSFDWIDNGGRKSANHIVTWIPPLRLGDASPIGYVRYVELFRGLSWWAPEVPFLGATANLSVDIHLDPLGEGSRLVCRMSGSAAGATARLAIGVFRIIDSIMAIRMLLGIKRRVETFGVRDVSPEDPETGDRNQYQEWEVVYASGESAGIRGKDQGARFHRAAREAGLIGSDPGHGSRH